MKKYYFPFFLLAAICIFISCAHQPPSVGVTSPGFFKGLWHGLIAPFALILSIFSDIRIYAFPNNGFWYDLGFVIGFLIIGGGGGASTGRRK